MPVTISPPRQRVAPRQRVVLCQRVALQTEQPRLSGRLRSRSMTRRTQLVVHKAKDDNMVAAMPPGEAMKLLTSLAMAENNPREVQRIVR